MRGPVIAEKDDFKPLLKSQIDAELARMRTMTAEEAAAAAAQAVAEAEAAMAEAEEAAKEAEAAEADAQEAQAFAEAAMRTLKNRNASRLVGVLAKCVHLIFVEFCLLCIWSIIKVEAH